MQDMNKNHGRSLRSVVSTTGSRCCKWQAHLVHFAEAVTASGLQVVYGIPVAMRDETVDLDVPCVILRRLATLENHLLSIYSRGYSLRGNEQCTTVANDKLRRNVAVLGIYGTPALKPMHVPSEDRSQRGGIGPGIEETSLYVRVVTHPLATVANNSKSRDVLQQERELAVGTGASGVG